MKTVLTVDDSKVVRALIARNLGDYGVRVVEAENGRDGVRAARLHRPDLILLDVTMPVMDGRAALTALRSDPKTRSIPVIMLSAESREDLVGEFMRLGVVGHIVKPFLQATFDAEVAKVLGWPGDTQGARPVDRDASTTVADETARALAAAREAASATEEVLQGLLEDVNGCAVLTLPEQATTLARVVPAALPLWLTPTEEKVEESCDMCCGPAMPVEPTPMVICWVPRSSTMSPLTGS